MAMGMKNRRKVSFADSVETREVPPLDPEQIANLFYCKLDFRGFKNDQLLEQDKYISTAIRRLIKKTVDDMDDRLAHAEKVQDIEDLLINRSKKLDREMTIKELRGAGEEREDAMYEEALRIESARLDEERLRRSQKRNKSARLYTETTEFIELSRMLEDSCSSLLNFQPIEFVPEFSSS